MGSVLLKGTGLATWFIQKIHVSVPPVSSCFVFEIGSYIAQAGFELPKNS